MAREWGREYADGMMELSYRRHRFPPVVIQHAVWLYLRFTLSYRTLRICSPSVGSTSPTKPSGAGC
jgi:transposase-like protein